MLAKLKLRDEPLDSNLQVFLRRRNILKAYDNVFMNEPWNDDWSNEEQLDEYMLDLSGNRNSLAIGLYDAEELVAVSLGSIMHWCTGTEYYIYEFFVTRERQGKGLGTEFIKDIIEYVKKLDVNHIFLQTEREYDLLHLRTSVLGCFYVQNII